MSLFEEQKRVIVTAYLADPQAKLALCQAMTRPLRTTRDYGKPCESCGRSFSYDAGGIVRTGGADDGCADCVVRLVLES